VSARVRRIAGRAGALGVLTVCLSSCGLLPKPHSPQGHPLPPPKAPAPAVLIIITNPNSPSAMRETASLLAASARTGEKVVLLDDHTGTTLATSTAPSPPSVQVPAPPAPLAQHPTSFQKARYASAVSQYKATVKQAEVTLRERQQTEFRTWATRTVASAQTSLTRQHDQGANIGASLGAAAADLSSMRQVGIGNAASAVIAIVGTAGNPALPAPVPPAGLQGSTVVVNDFPSSSAAEAAWQASLLQAGARRVMLLTAATGNQLAPLVRQAMDATITDTLTNVLFRLGQYKLSPAALPELHRLLRQLTVQYPNATATIIGYTDDLPTPGGNLRLSQLRAQAVAEWLITQGVASYRLQTFGYGAADPVAPNTASGQPLNRRVDVIIDPTFP
jgi:outer membrane protein OmpA-like peptidoglycan-associated protein